MCLRPSGVRFNQCLLLLVPRANRIVEVCPKDRYHCLVFCPAMKELMCSSARTHSSLRIRKAPSLVQA